MRTLADAVLEHARAMIDRADRLEESYKTLDGQSRALILRAEANGAMKILQELRDQLEAVEYTP